MCVCFSGLRRKGIYIYMISSFLLPHWFRNWTQVIRFNGKFLFLISHFANPIKIIKLSCLHFFAWKTCRKTSQAKSNSDGVCVFGGWGVFQSSSFQFTLELAYPKTISKQKIEIRMILRLSCWVSLFRTQNVNCPGGSHVRYLPKKNLVSQTYLQTITSSGRNQRDILRSTCKHISLIYQLILTLGTYFPPGFLQKHITLTVLWKRQFFTI